MTQTTINTALFPNPPALLTVHVGDHVQHWSGDTGVVDHISREFLYVQEFPGGEEPVYGIHLYVIADRRPRQRKPSAPARWDGIIAVITAQQITQHNG